MFKVLRSGSVTTFGTDKRKPRHESDIDTVIGKIDGRQAAKDIILNDISECMVFDSQSKYKDIRVYVDVTDGKRHRRMSYEIVKED